MPLQGTPAVVSFAARNVNTRLGWLPLSLHKRHNNNKRNNMQCAIFTHSHTHESKIIFMARGNECWTISKQSLSTKRLLSSQIYLIFNRNYTQRYVAHCFRHVLRNLIIKLVILMHVFSVRLHLLTVVFLIFSRCILSL